MAKRRPRLTKYEKEVLERVAQEFLAGHDAEMTKACGLAETEEEGEKVLAALNSAVSKL